MDNGFAESEGMRNLKYLLGIDLGTSGTKTVLFEETGRAVASETIEYPLYQPKNGWAEQEPEDWWNAARDTVKAVIAKSGVKPENVKGVGISGQMHGLVLLDREGRVLRRSILWCDGRTQEECDEITQTIGKERLIELSANPALTGFTAGKILWVRKHEPEVYEKAAHILLPKDYIRYKLTGEYATEVSDASGMQLMDVAKRTWSDEILEGLGIEKRLLGKMYESQDVTGEVHQEAAALTGLAAGTIVVGGAGDNPAAAIGTGIVSQGKAFTTIGTSAVVYAVSDRMALDPKGRVHTLCASVPGKWTVMSCTQAAGLSLQWLRNHVCTPEMAEAAEKGVDPYEIMTAEAARVPIGSEKLIYLPYLMGERSPHPDPDCRGVFFGLSAMHERPHLIRSVMEGISFSQWECVEVFREMGVPIEDMMICGGGGRSPFWRQMLADMYGCSVSTVQSDQGGALGAAILAGVGAGIYSDLETACDALVRKKDSSEPNMAANGAYVKYFTLYKELYRTLFQSFKDLKNI